MRLPAGAMSLLRCAPRRKRHQGHPLYALECNGCAATDAGARPRLYLTPRPKSYSTGSKTQKLLHWQPPRNATPSWHHAAATVRPRRKRHQGYPFKLHTLVIIGNHGDPSYYAFGYKFETIHGEEKGTGKQPE